MKYLQVKSAQFLVSGIALQICNLFYRSAFLVLQVYFKSLKRRLRLNTQNLWFREFELRPIYQVWSAYVLVTLVSPALLDWKVLIILLSRCISSDSSSSSSASLVEMEDSESDFEIPRLVSHHQIPSKTLTIDIECGLKSALENDLKYLSRVCPNNLSNIETTSAPNALSARLLSKLKEMVRVCKVHDERTSVCAVFERWLKNALSVLINYVDHAFETTGTGSNKQEILRGTFSLSFKLCLCMCLPHWCLQTALSSLD